MARAKQPPAAGKELAGNTVDLTVSEEREVRQRSGLRTEVVFEAILREGRDELDRAPAALAFSGLAAGLSMGFSLLFMGLLQASLPDASWRPLVVYLGYTAGFVLVILARQQLFTENTITAIIPLLDSNDRSRTFVKVARLWGIVLGTNLVGAAIFALAISHAPIVDANVAAQMAQIGSAALAPSATAIFVRAIFAGWLLALMVWLLPSADTQKLIVVVMLTYLVGLFHFNHAIAGSVDGLYAVFTAHATFAAYAIHFLIPTVLGNALGGVILVSLLGYGQVAPKQQPPS